ncbi:MAG: hypothetical protein Q8R32_01765 [bacterium]|nr:hypothetical protein [bacterium]
MSPATRVTTEQMSEFLQQDAKHGLHDRFQQFLTGGNQDPLDQLWFAVGRPLALAKTKEQYRNRFPDLPEFDSRVHRHHTHCLPFEPKASVTDLAKGFRIQFNGTDDTFEPWDGEKELPQWNEPHWMWCQPGTWFLNWEPRKVRSEGCAVKEYPCSEREGLHIWGLTGPYPFATDCPRSVGREDREYCAYLGFWELDWSLDEDAHPDYGAASRGE